ncbi:MAG TPA: sigma-54 dependent transcriptional regulator [Vicinamibacteria bacterium]|nr:sigma-54 dependent transcriptional regulator [Vicinamibacteria bacterium]
MKAGESTIQVLLVDDDDSLRTALASELEMSGFRIRAAINADEAIRETDNRTFDVAIVDLNLPGMSGEELLSELRERSPSTEIVILTGHGTVENAVRTLKNGAYDFLTKPCNLDELEAVLRRAFEKRSLVRENRLLQRELARHDRFKEFIGDSSALRSVLDLISKVSQTDSTVLIQGESGVGKELGARAIHRASARAHRPFIVVDCTSLQEALLQSELFGHERGAFTGAVARKHGLFEVADGGTLFLDEIGDIGPPVQARILRVLDTGTFRRVGGVQDIRTDARIICATNRVLSEMVKKGDFRQDLYFRINVVSITLPPLRERRRDIPKLARYFAEQSPIAGKGPFTFSPDAMAILESYSWPGNVRELQNVVERGLILAENRDVTVEDLPSNLRHDAETILREMTEDRPTLAELEHRYIKRLLQEFRGHRGRVAEVLGISERNLYRKLKNDRPLQDVSR